MMENFKTEVEFEVKNVLTAEGIILCAHSQNGSTQTLGLVTQNGDLILLYIAGENPAVVKRIPWFLEKEKKICALAFDPSGSWLLVVGLDGFIHIVPALALIDSQAISDVSWNPLDLTSFSPVSTSTPTCCVWWQSISLGKEMAIVGTESGEVVLVNLHTGQRTWSTWVQNALSSLHIVCCNSSRKCLLLTCVDQQQYQKLLEDCCNCWIVDPETLKTSSKSSRNDSSTTICPAPTRSRLQGLKQMSVEKLAIIRQRLTETRSKGNSLTPTSSSASRRGSTSSDGSSSPCTNTSQLPEKLKSNLYLWPQLLDGRHLFSARHTSSTIVSILEIDIEKPPLHNYKLPSPCSNILYTEHFLYVTDSRSKNISVVPSKLPEYYKDEELECYPNSIIDTFEFPDTERIIALFNFAAIKQKNDNAVPVVSASGNNTNSTAESSESASPVRQANQQTQKESIETTLDSLCGHPLDTCIVVTSNGVHKLTLSKSVGFVVLDHLLAGINPENQGRLGRAQLLASLFMLDLKKLLEIAGDMQLLRGHLFKAIELYKMSQCRETTSLLKLASRGHVSQFLDALDSGSCSNSHSFMSSERVVIGCLVVLCFAQELLQYPSNDLEKSLLKFLREDQYYDEKLAVDVLGSAGLWMFLSDLARNRGLLAEVFFAQTKVMSQILLCQKNFQFHLATFSPQSGFWECITELPLQETLLQNTDLLRTHIQYSMKCLPEMDVNILKRLAVLYDPSAPSFRPIFCQLLHSRKREFPNIFGGSFAEIPDKVLVMKELISAFILVLNQLWCIYGNKQYYAKLSEEHIQKPSQLVEEQVATSQAEVLSPVTTELSAGFCHAAVLRNSGVLIWGHKNPNSADVDVHSFELPRFVPLFRSLNISVLSVSCGKTHTLALTDNGVYSWGFSNFGQLGIGAVSRSAHPRLVTGLLDQRIVAVCAGQFHSVALSSAGRMFTWGWGLHGQLGHKSVQGFDTPKLVSALENEVVSAVAAGYAHTLILLSSGEVLGCGSSEFGQLGTGGRWKSRVPVPVNNLPESIAAISTSYFHNLALSKSNRLYTWGCSPQLLRLQANSPLRARVLQKQHEQLQQLQSTLQQKQKLEKNLKHVNSDVSCKPQENHSEKIAEIPLELTNCNGKSTDVLNGNISPPLSPKTPNNIRLNDSQDIFVDPLNARLECPPSNVYKEECIITEQIEIPIPHLHAEAVLNVNSDEIPPVSPMIAPSDSNQCAPSDAEDKSPPVVVDQETGQLHLQPTLVDTSEIQGIISEISCGLHHSALITEEGRLYTWGFNRDFQLGFQERRDSPNPLQVDNIRAVQVACGADYTLALEARTGDIMAWGNNGRGQLGRIPDLTGKAALKIPKGTRNHIKTPSIIPFIPPVSTERPYPSSGLNIVSVCRNRTKLSMGSLEDPAFCAHMLHYSLQDLNSFYNKESLLNKFDETTNYQAQGRLSFLDGVVHEAFQYYCKALFSFYKNNRSSLQSGEEIVKNSSEKLISEHSEPKNPLANMSTQLEQSNNLPILDAQEKSSSSTTTLTGESNESSHADNSLENQDMHAFSVQGGNEEMSEGTESDKTKSNLNPSDETSSLASISLKDEEVAIVPHISLKSEGLTKNSESNNANKDSALSLSNNEVDHELAIGKSGCLEREVIRLFELHMKLLHNENEKSSLDQLMRELVLLWVSQSLNTSFLETFIEQFWDDLWYSFALVLFCSECPMCSVLVEALPSHFTLKLCSKLLPEIQNKGNSSQLSILLKCVMPKNNLSDSAANSSFDSVDQIVQQLGNSVVEATPLHIKPLEDCLQNDNIIAFSCGHRLNEDEYLSAVETARSEGSPLSSILTALPKRDGTVLQHGCPSCVYEYIQRISL